METHHIEINLMRLIDDDVVVMMMMMIEAQQ
jgi:hypothetical protein